MEVSSRSAGTYTDSESYQKIIPQDVVKWDFEMEHANARKEGEGDKKKI